MVSELARQVAQKLPFFKMEEGFTYPISELCFPFRIRYFTTPCGFTPSGLLDSCCMFQ